MKRREFIAGLAAAGWPLAARAEDRALPTIGWLHSSLDSEQDYIPAFYRGLAETGFVEGRNVAVEHRWSGQGPARAADLVHRQVAVIVVVTNRALVLIANSIRCPAIAEQQERIAEPFADCQECDADHPRRFFDWR
jgi:putative tryptophan/tyrosine transport system substrate-binding protein